MKIRRRQKIAPINALSALDWLVARITELEQQLADMTRAGLAVDGALKWEQRQGPPSCPGCGHDPHSPGMCVMLSGDSATGTCQCPVTLR